MADDKNEGKSNMGLGNIDEYEMSTISQIESSKKKGGKKKPLFILICPLLVLGGGGLPPIVLTSPRIRLFLKNILNEIAKEISVVSISKLSLT